MIQKTLIAFATMGLLLLPITATAQSEGEIRTIESGKPIEKEITGDKTHQYLLTLAKDQHARISVEPTNIDITVALLDGNGKKLIEDRASGKQELFSVVAEQPETYRLEVRSTRKEAPAIVQSQEGPTDSDGSSVCTK